MLPKNIKSMSLVLVKIVLEFTQKYDKFTFTGQESISTLGVR